MFRQPDISVTDCLQIWHTMFSMFFTYDKRMLYEEIRLLHFH